MARHRSRRRSRRRRRAPRARSGPRRAIGVDHDRRPERSGHRRETDRGRAGVRASRRSHRASGRTARRRGRVARPPAPRSRSSGGFARLRIPIRRWLPHPRRGAGPPPLPRSGRRSSARPSIHAGDDGVALARSGPRPKPPPGPPKHRAILALFGSPPPAMHRRPLRTRRRADPPLDRETHQRRWLRA